MKHLQQRLVRQIAVLSVTACVATIHVQAQQRRITRPIDNTRRFTLAGHVPPRARAEFDQGRVSPSLDLKHVTLTLAPSVQQQADLTSLLAAQQDPASPEYHHWLTPEEYAARFGANDADLTQIKSWLESQGLTVTGVARGRNWISADGTAAQVEQALQTEIHEYVVDGKTHFANATEPSLPAAFSGVIRSIRGLNNFRMKPASLRAPSNLASPDYTSTRGNHYLAPNDFATIYDINPIYAAGIDGTGQKIVVAGQTQINLSDIEEFRTSYSLAGNDPQVVFVPGTKDPGLSSTDLPEADLDLEWSGAVARNATIYFVYTNDVMDSIQYAIDQNLAPVITSSYGLCEAETGRADALTFQGWAQQGNAEGITWFNASGDAGGADCDDSTNPGLGVDIPAAIPEVTGVGGTEFSEGSGQFWNTSNGNGQSSVLSYIPETTWNDSATDGQPSASGGGASTFFTKPSWQTGPGVPSDNARHVPDVAFNASADHDGYLVYTGGQVQVYGGTSAPTPAFAGMIALLNQYQVSRGAQSSPGVGNLNPKLYALAQSASGAFHDVTTGNNIVTVSCSTRSRGCTASPVGYSAGTGYDQVTGLGSLDAYAFFNSFSGTAITPIQPVTSITLVASPTSITVNGTLNLTATVSSTDGVTPTGTVAFADGTVSLGSAVLSGSGGTATATITVAGMQLPQGSAILTAEYNGNANTTASVTVSVTSATPSNKPVITSLVNGASFKPVFAPGMVLTIFGSQLAASAQTASVVPLPRSMATVAVTVNGVAAPLYYVSSGQLNVQLPYETATNTTAFLNINNNGQTTSQTFNVAPTAPGIFTDQNGAPVPNTSAARGEEIILYITGAGALTPQVATGDAPAAGTAVSSLPAPTQNVSVTVGGAQAKVDFVGVTPGLVGVVQINYEVPAGIPTGAQQVVVTVGSASSPPATLTVTN